MEASFNSCERTLCGISKHVFVRAMWEDQSMLASGFTLMPLYSDKDPEFVPAAAAEEHARWGKVHGRSETCE